MRKALFLAVLFTFASVATAQAAEATIAVFNSRAVAAKSEPFLAAQKKVMDQFGAEKTRLDTQGKQLQKQADDLQKQQTAMSREALAEKGDQFVRAKRNFEDAMQSYERKVQTSFARVQQEFVGRLFQSLQDYGAKKNYSLILDATVGVGYYDKSVDVTEDIIKEVTRVYREGKPVGGSR